MQNFDVSAFDIFDKRWALVTAGSKEGFNTMTVSWGGLGTLWGKPAATVYIKPARYTYAFMEQNDFFTVSFFPPEFKADLTVLGTKSGRDGDKLALTKLTPKFLPDGVTFEQAETTLVCRKMYFQDMTLENMPQSAIDRFYTVDAPHRMYIGEVTEIIK